MNLSELQKKIHEVNVANGWWEEDRNIGETLMLIVTEVAEAMEDYRDGKMTTFFSKSSDYRKPEGFPSEIADIVIRCLDLAEAHGIDLEKEIEQKIAYNTTRGYRHGGKKA